MWLHFLAYCSFLNCSYGKTVNGQFLKTTINVSPNCCFQKLTINFSSITAFQIHLLFCSFHIANQCRRKSSYLLEYVAKVLVKRSATPTEGEVGKKFNFIEFGGKHFIKYNIVNINDLNQIQTILFAMYLKENKTNLIVCHPTSQVAIKTERNILTIK